MGKADCAVMRIMLFNKSISVKSAHFVNCENADASKGVGRHINCFTLGNIAYKLAVNGRGAKVRGGGSAQAASTLYLAVKNLPNVYMVEKHTYGDRYNQTYVTFPEDAIMVDYSGAKDFRFTYYGNKALTIYMYEVSGILYCNVYER